MTTSTDNETSSPAAGSLPQGTWRVDPASSELVFKARGMFGLAMVNGRFNEFDGELHVDDTGTKGELRIKATSLDTANAKRDKHLRSRDFFDVEEHDTVSFTLSGVEQSPEGGATLSGTLRIRQSSLRVTAPLEIIKSGADQLQLRTTLDVDRAAAGVGWSKLGMIRGDAHLDAKVTLKLQS
jgi:polyisoprenoid-binding protein YceI